jgi:hypothetical protein
MSDANRTQVGVIEESTFGTTPASPVFETLRVTGEPNLAYQPITTASNEIRSDRQVTDLPLVDKEAGGNIEMELSFGAQDTLLEGALFDDWTELATRKNETTTQITGVTAVDDTYACLTGTAYAQYMMIKTTGFTNSANNAVFEAQSGTSATAVVAPDQTADETPGTNAVMRQVGFVGPSADITATANGLGSTLLDFTTMNLAVGMWVKIGGTAAGDQFATTALNGYARISVIAANALTFDVLPTGWTTDTGTGKTIKVWLGDYLRNSTTQKSYSIERQYLDHSPVTYEVFTGMSVDTFNLSADAATIVDSTFGFLGKDASMSTTRTSGASDKAAPTNDVLNSSSNVASIREGGTEISGANFVLNMSVNVANNLRRNTAVGSIGAIEMGVGESTITGELTTYFDDSTLVDKVVNNTETSLDFRFKDDSNQVIVYDMPRVKYSSGAPDVTGKNTDVTANLGYQALRDTTLGYQLQIQRMYYTES